MSLMQQSDRASQHPAWQALTTLAERARQTSLAARFADAPDRAHHWRREGAALTLELSRHHLDGAILDALIDLAKAQQLPARIAALMAGAIVNETEKRPALHPALRAEPTDRSVSAQLARMSALAKRLRSGAWLGFDERPITDIVNIGIGGSDLGPRMAVTALRTACAPLPRVHFVANVDPADLASQLRGLDPATTLFIVASKSFKTQETQVNANAARRWLRRAGATEKSIARHFVAVTAAPARARQWGVAEEHILAFAEGVGGRYSLWSAIGFPIMCAIGPDAFSELLAGARAMDDHFAATPLAENLPFLLGALDVWYTGFWGAASIAVLPYYHDLGLLPSYLQQLTMESNGKRVTRCGEPVDYATGPVFWGEAGTRGQHSFHQLLHQGTAFIPCDFILPLTSPDDTEQYRLLVASCLAQAQVLMAGIDAVTAGRELIASGMEPAQAALLAKHKAMPGDRPSTLITMRRLTPATLGALLALYEHRVFVSAVLWGINPFDQWGVELGKKISDSIAPLLNDTSAPEPADPVTAHLIAAYHAAQHEIFT